MKIISLLSVLLLAVMLSLDSFCQEFIGLTQQAAKKRLQYYINTKKLHTITIQTDSSLTFQVRDTTVLDLDLLLFFNDKGVCFKQETILTCDSCLQKIFDEAMSNKKYGWKKVSNGRYVSKPSKGLLLEETSGERFVLTVKRYTVNRREYRLLQELDY